MNHSNFRQIKTKMQKPYSALKTNQTLCEFRQNCSTAVIPPTEIKEITYNTNLFARTIVFSVFATSLLHFTFSAVASSNSRVSFVRSPSSWPIRALIDSSFS